MSAAPRSHNGSGVSSRGADHSGVPDLRAIAQADYIAELEERVRQLEALLVPVVVFPESLRLTLLEGRVLSVIYQRAPKIATPEHIGAMLFEDCWDYGGMLRVMVSRIRKKLPAWCVITTTRSIGYYMERKVADKLRAFIEREGSSL